MSKPMSSEKCRTFFLNNYWPALFMRVTFQGEMGCMVGDKGWSHISEFLLISQHWISDVVQWVVFQNTWGHIGNLRFFY